MKGHRMLARAGWTVLLALVAFQAQAQTPTINPPNGAPPGLQSGAPPSPTPTLPAAITVDTNLPNGFVLYINGKFNPQNFQNVSWTNTVTGQTQTFAVGGGVLSVTATQVQVTIPPSLFSNFSIPVSAPQPITITVTEQASAQPPTTASATYTLNPAISTPPEPAIYGTPDGYIPVPGTTGVPYSQPMAQFGTPPYVMSLSQGSNPQPSGLILPVNSVTLAGTPANSTAGLYVFSVHVVDTWSNAADLLIALEIDDPPTATTISTTSVPAGSPAFTLTVNGTNFVAPQTPIGGQIPGSTAIYNVTASGPTSLATTFVNANQLTAAVPQNLLITPGAASVLVQQPSGASSNSIPFNVLAPTILSLSPPVITARTTPITLTVNGANFVANSTLTPAASTIFLGTNAVSTSLVNGNTLTTSQTFSTPGQINVTVENPGQSVSTPVALQVVAAPSITSLSPSFATAGVSSFLLTVTGKNFLATTQIVFNGIALATTYVNSTTLTATVASRSPFTVGTLPVTVIMADGFSPTPVTFPIYAPLLITTPSLPGGTYQLPYSSAVAATGGLPPYLWSATGLQGLSINKTTGAITGTITSNTTFTISVTVTDANGTTATVPFTINVTVPIPPVQFSGVTLPSGMVGVAYSAALSASGGNGNISFGVTGGSLPPGLNFFSNGSITGTPTTFGTFTFNVQASDTTGNSTTVPFSILIKPALLTVTGPSSIPSIVVGASVGLKFGATGGVPPYQFNFTGNLPAGTGLGRDGSLTGTANAAGTFGFTIYVTDSLGTQASKGFSVTVALPQLVVTASLPDGQVGAGYTGSVVATGGQPPYSISVSGLPDGLTFANGVVTGTPTTAGSFTVKVSATDALSTQAGATLTVNIAPPTLAISISFGDGAVGSTYSGSASATGGVPPYTFTFGGLPAGVTGSSNGSVSGSPTASGPFTITATVTDSKGATASKSATVNIAAPPALLITSASIPNPTVGVAVSTNFTASGGVPPYTWSATAFPPGLTLSTSGAVSGTPTAPGSTAFTLKVTDSLGNFISRTVTVIVALPPAPPVNLTGLPTTSNPATQSTLQIGIGTAYPVDVTVTLTLTFAPDAGADDPTVQFATGGRTATLTIPAGSLVSLTSIGVQTGTVAGTATITAKLVAATQDITPAPPPTRTVRINAAAPSLSGVNAAIGSNGFTVTVTGYVTTRSITQAIFTFTPATGANLQTTTVTIAVDQIFAAWFASAGAAAFGSQFTFTQPFTVQGGVSAIASVTVVLVNANGTSTAATATLH